MSVANIKRGLLASFFLLSIAQPLSIAWSTETTTAQLETLSQNKQWAALLHTSERHSYIRDPKFFLSTQPFHLKNELMATIQAFHKKTALNNQHALCRFPARYMWLKEKLNWVDKDFPSPLCSAYAEYLDKVPATDIQLVFASENITSPTSMMGHVFLKLSGQTSSHFNAEHAVTYFTVLDSFNVPKIIYQNFTENMLGIFSLQPYKKIKSNYLNKEKRNIWEYSLNLTSAQKSLLQAHIWELKSIASDYLFASYNCATVTYFLLALNEPQLLEVQHQWITPIDVVKTLKSLHLITKTNIITSNQWKIQMLLDNQGQNNMINPQQIQKLAYNTLLLSKQLSPTNQVLALSYLQYLKTNKPSIYVQNKQKYLNIETKLSDITSNYRFDYSNYKDPTKAPGNSQYQLSLGQNKSFSFVDFSFLPASIRLTDDHRQFFSSHALSIAELNARLTSQGRVKLNYFNIFAVKSLNPWNTYTRNISGQWRLSIEPHLDEKLDSHLVLNASAGLGYTLQLSTDITASALYNIGAATNVKQRYIYHNPEFILQVNEIWNMKTTLRYQANFNMYASSMRNDYLKACQSYYPEQNQTWLACFEQSKNKNSALESFKISFQQHF